MTHAQPGVQKCLVVLACKVEIVHQPPKARAIEVHECDLNIVPVWRGILAADDHGHESFKESFCASIPASSKYTSFQKANVGRI
jgi:hypothetical protein